jgi:hypothetical protein
LSDPRDPRDRLPQGRSAGRPLRLVAVFEVAVDVLARHWRALLAVSLLLAGPGALLTAVLGLRLDVVMRDVVPDIGAGLPVDVPTLTRAQLDRLVGALAGYFVATLVAGLLGSIAAVSMSWLALSGPDSEASLTGALRAGLRRTIDIVLFMLVTGAVVVGLIVSGLLAMTLAVSLLSSGPVTRGGPGVFLALVIGVALVVALVYLSVRWALAFPTLAAEPVGWREALSRSWRLSHEHVWRILVIVLAGGLVTVVVGAFVSQVAAIILVDVLAATIGIDTDIAESFALALGTVVLAPLSPLLLAASYRHLVGTPGAARDGSGAE